MNKTIMVLLIATGLVLAVAGGFYLGKGSEPTEAPAVAERDSAQTPTEVTRDVPGLPALYIEGREYEKNDITLSEYFAEFNTEAVIDPETKKIRPESAAKIWAVFHPDRPLKQWPWKQITAPGQIPDESVLAKPPVLFPKVERPPEQ